MKKYLLVAVALLTLQTVTFGEQTQCPYMNALKQTGQEYGKTLAPFYTNLKTCTPYTGDITRIYGKENNQCHFKMLQLDCRTPFIVSEQYGKMGSDVMQALANWDEKNLMNFYRVKDALTEFENSTIKYFCR